MTSCGSPRSGGHGSPDGCRSANQRSWAKGSVAERSADGDESRAGDGEQAVALLEEALQIAESSEPVDGSVIASSLTALGEHHLRQRRPRVALELLERAAKHPAATGADEGHEAKTGFALARALVQTGGDRTRALQLARAAQKTWTALGRGWEESLEQVDAWLSERDRG